MTRDVYNSSTLGPIPLSFMGRHLLQELREAIVEMRTNVINDAVTGRYAAGDKSWEPISRVRGKIAKYMSELESRRIDSVTALRFASDEQLRAEWKRRGYATDPRPTPGPWKVDESKVSTDFLGPFGKAAVQSQFDVKVEVERENVAAGPTWVLPAIPEGYSLTILGNVVSICKDETISGSAPQEFVQPGPSAKEETCAEFLKRLGTDADAWAKEFMRKRPAPDNYADTLETLRGYFANAIEQGRQARPAEPAKAASEILENLIHRTINARDNAITGNKRHAELSDAVVHLRSALDTIRRAAVSL